jgi:hypothetical protein
MSDAASTRASVSSAEVAAWFAVVAILTLFVHPGLGIVAALVLDFTRLRHSSTAVRIGLVALAVVILAVQIVGLQAGDGTGEVGTPVQITVG